MAISKQEQKDLDIAKTKVGEIKLETYNLMTTYLEMDSTMLGHCGQKTVEGALLSSMTHAQKKIQGIWKAHLKKYPD